MEMELELEDLPPKALRKMLRTILAKGMKKSDEEKDADIEKADKERQELSDLHEEGSGKAPRIPVLEDDMPEGLGEEDEKPAKGKKKGK